MDVALLPEKQKSDDELYTKSTVQYCMSVGVTVTICPKALFKHTALRNGFDGSSLLK